MFRNGAPLGRQPLAEFHDAVLGYGKKAVIVVPELQIWPGERILITGENGSGKSTLFRTLLSEADVLDGSVRFFGEPPKALAPPKLFSGQVAYMPQTQAVFEPLTVEEHLALSRAFRGTGDASWRQKLTAILNDRIERRQKIIKLSGGERRWLALTLSLFAASKILLLDEPLAGLSSSWAADAVRLIESYLQISHAACIVIEHRTTELTPLGCVERRAIIDSDDLARLV